MNMIRLNNGVMMPDFGLGTFHSTDEKECAEAVRAAVKCGYRIRPASPRFSARHTKKKWVSGSVPITH